MARRSRRAQEGCALDMTPMIDVVFQLIIFFIVTLKVTEEANPDIILEDGRHGEIITADNQPTETITIEVSRRGRVSINNAVLSPTTLQDIIRRRYNRFGPFPVMIRADYRTRHDDVRRVMDICSANGVWKVGFIAVQDRRVKDAPRPR